MQNFIYLFKAQSFYVIVYFILLCQKEEESGRHRKMSGLCEMG